MENQLDAEIAHFRSKTYAENTKKAYKCHRKSYINFCMQFGYRAVPVNHIVLCRYTAFLARRLTVSSIKKYLNIVRIMHLELGFSNPLKENWFVDSVIKGISRDKGLSVKRKLPITPNILLKIKSLLNLNVPVDAMFWAACLVAFFGFFRKSNLFPPNKKSFDESKHLCRSDFSLHPWGIMLKIKWSKTIQFGERLLQSPIPLLRNHPLCPVSALIQAFRITKLADSNGPAFVVPTANSFEPMSPINFVKQLRGILNLSGLPAQDYSGHSFRRGSASWAIQNGIPGEVIKILGDWKSDAYLSYLSLNSRAKINSIYQFSEGLPGGS